MSDTTSLSSIIGNIAFILILIPTIITALEKLELKGISDPAIAMLQDVVSVIPNIAVAVILILSRDMAWKMGGENRHTNAMAFKG